MGDSRQMHPDGSRDEEPSEPNQSMHDEHKEVREETAREGNGASEEGESKINDAVGDVKDAYGGDAVLPGQHLVLLPPHSGSTVRWERFLPVRSLNVLLVENDDSTRQLVSALLRNCSYEVIAVADALQAWETLEDVKTRVDLVLTEVAMPCLSGVGLLSRIMSHRIYKNIPVIMMSSNDSMGVVFKCLSKGAADFFVKPIRKNELKNLWQHVWRRCHSSWGSGSESGIQGHKIPRSNSPTDSDNNTGSNGDDNDDGDQNGNFGLNLRDGSDNGSGTQNSWTKRAVEDDSPQLVSASDQLADPHDSTCAKVTNPKLDMFLNDWVPSMNNECLEHKEFADTKFAENMALPWNHDKKHASYPTEKVSTEVTSPKVGKLHEHIQKPEVDEGVRGESSNASCGANVQVADLIGGIATNCEAQVSRVTDIPDGFAKISSCKDKPVEDSKELPSLELSLKRLRSSGDGDDENVLRHSNLSAFSWYNNSTASPHASKGYGGGYSIPHDNSEAINAESTSNMLNAMSMNKSSNGSSYNNDMGSTTNDAFPKPGTYKDKAASPSTVKNIHNLASHTWPHVTPAIQPMMQDKVDDVAVVAMAEQTRRMQRQVQVEHHHHHYHHHHYHVHGVEKQQQQQPPPGNDDMSLKNMAAAAPQCGLSDMFPGPLEGNAANYSLNGSASGSNYGSNGQNGSTTAVNVERTNLENDPGVAAKNEAGGAVSGTDQNRSSQREAALNKFRQKRKERNFGKKVRYQSRKRLAEQRPRVRGQFVRRTAHEQNNPEAAC